MAAIYAAFIGRMVEFPHGSMSARVMWIDNLNVLMEVADALIEKIDKAEQEQFVSAVRAYTEAEKAKVPWNVTEWRVPGDDDGR